MICIVGLPFNALRLGLKENCEAGVSFLCLDTENAPKLHKKVLADCKSFQEFLPLLVLSTQGEKNPSSCLWRMTARDSLGNRCRIRFVSSPLKLVPDANSSAASPRSQERNWLPMAIAAGVVLLVLVVAVFLLEHGKKGKL